MAARRSPGARRGELEDLDGWFRASGLNPRRWSNGPGDRYGWHDHPYHKVLVCQQGGIVFHTRDGDLRLEPGDRLDIEPGTEHAATVGSRGVTCVEAPREAGLGDVPA
jgi:quercetin dioxygenase-like cupin family protein